MFKIKFISVFGVMIGSYVFDTFQEAKFRADWLNQDNYCKKNYGLYVVVPVK